MKQTLKNKIVGVVASGVLLAELALPIVYVRLNSRSETVDTSRGEAEVCVWNDGNPRGIEVYQGGMPGLTTLSDTNRDYMVDRKTHIFAAPRRGIYTANQEVTSADQALFDEAISKASIL